MEDYNWQKLSSEVQHHNPYFEVIRDRVVLPTQQIADYFYVSELDSVMIIPIKSPTELVMLHQYRYLLGRLSWEFPCGTIRSDETPIQAASRELEEEAGYRADILDSLFVVNVSTGTTSERMHMFLARNLIKTKQVLEATERKTDVHLLTIERATMLVSQGDIACGQTLLCLLYLIPRWEKVRGL